MNWGAAVMFTKRKGELSIEYVVIAVITIALLIVFVVYSGILKGQLSLLVKKVISFFTGGS